MAPKTTAPQKKKAQGDNGKMIKKQKVTSKPKDAIVMARKTIAPRKRKLQGGDGKIIKKAKITEVLKFLEKFPELSNNAEKWKERFAEVSPDWISIDEDASGIRVKWQYPKKHQNWTKSFYFMEIRTGRDCSNEDVFAAVDAFFKYLEVKQVKLVYIDVHNWAKEISSTPLFRKIDELVVTPQKGAIKKFCYFARRCTVKKLVLKSSEVVIPAQLFRTKLFQNCKNIDVEENICQMKDDEFLKNNIVTTKLHIESSQLSFKAIRAMVDRLEKRANLASRTFILGNLNGRPFNMRELFGNDVFYEPTYVGNIRIHIENWTTVHLNWKSPIEAPDRLENYGKLPELPMERILSFLDRATLKNYAQTAKACNKQVQRFNTTSPKIFRFLSRLERTSDCSRPLGVHIQLVYEKLIIKRTYEIPINRVKQAKYIEKKYHYTRDGGTKEIYLDSVVWPEYIFDLSHFNRVNYLLVLYDRRSEHKLHKYIEKWPLHTLQLRNLDHSFNPPAHTIVPADFFKDENLRKITEFIYADGKCDIEDDDFLRLDPKELRIRTSTVSEQAIQQKMRMMVAEENRCKCQTLGVRVPTTMTFNFPDVLDGDQPVVRIRRKRNTVEENHRYIYLSIDAP